MAGERAGALPEKVVCAPGQHDTTCSRAHGDVAAVLPTPHRLGAERGGATKPDRALAAAERHRPLIRPLGHALGHCGVDRLRRVVAQDGGERRLCVRHGELEDGVGRAGRREEPRCELRAAASHERHKLRRRAEHVERRRQAERVRRKSGACSADAERSGGEDEAGRRPPRSHVWQI